jgi:hypothetical protein
MIVSLCICLIKWLLCIVPGEVGEKSGLNNLDIVLFFIYIRDLHVELTEEIYIQVTYV